MAKVSGYNNTMLSNNVPWFGLLRENVLWLPSVNSK